MSKKSDKKIKIMPMTEDKVAAYDNEIIIMNFDHELLHLDVLVAFKFELSQDEINDFEDLEEFDIDYLDDDFYVITNPPNSLFYEMWQIVPEIRGVIWRGNITDKDFDNLMKLKTDPNLVDYENDDFGLSSVRILNKDEYKSKTNMMFELIRNYEIDDEIYGNQVKIDEDWVEYNQDEINFNRNLKFGMDDMLDLINLKGGLDKLSIKELKMLKIIESIQED